MALKPTLSLKQTQRISLTPELRQSLTLLQMPTAELMELIRSEAIDNPLLQVKDPVNPHKSDISAYDFALRTVCETITLGDSIRRQLAIMPLSQSIKEIALYLTGDLSESGFLETSVEETSTALGVSTQNIQMAILAIQTCEPTGVGARDLNECLLLQMIENGVKRDIAQSVLDHIPLLVDGNWPELSNLVGVPENELMQLAKLLRSLNPKPVMDHSAPPRPMVADIIVENTENRGLTVRLPKQYLPEMSINTALIAQAKPDASSAKYIEHQQARAKNLIRAVQYRGETLLRIARTVVSHQHRYFLDGPEYMSPLTRRQIASKLSLHPSTIGRAIADKNLEFGGALLPIGYFLGASLKKGAAGHISTYMVQNEISRLIDQESASAPLSDEAIVKKLQANGVDIARRTVAKYRGCMKIPSSFVRRKIAGAQQAPLKPPGRRENSNL